MATKAPQTAAIRSNQKTIRASISLPNDVHEALEKNSKEKRVSVAWVVRAAAEKYVSDEWPSLPSRG